MSLIYHAASRAFEAGFRVLGLRPTIHGLEHLPAEGPAIIASNHVGYLDFAFVMLGPPRPRREVRFLARGDLFERPVTGTMLRALRQIPVDAHGDPATTMRFARAALEHGELVGLHPEGTVNPTFQPLRGRSGAVRLSLQTGAPIIPAAVWGSQRLLTKWREPAWPGRGIPIQVRYGAPYLPSDGVPDGTPAEMTRQLIARITDLVQLCVEDEGAPSGSWWVPAVLGGGAPRLADVASRLQAQEAERSDRARRRNDPKAPEA